MNTKLTIAIPTYNRNKEIVNCVGSLISQFTNECCLLIIDNHSQIPVEESLKDLLTDSDIQSKTLRNSVNVGLSANIMRCFEYCETEYLWVIGDDDLAAPNAIETIFKYINKFPQSIFFNFVTPMVSRNNDIQTKGLNNFLDGVDSISNIGFISASFYKASIFREKIRIGYHYGYSFYPHLALIIASLENDEECVISKEQIALFTEYPTDEQRWSEITNTLGMPILLEIPNSDYSKQKLFQVLIQGMAGYRSFVVALMERGLTSGEKESARYLYEQFISRRIFFETRLYQKIAVLFYRLLFKFSPKIGIKLLKTTNYNDFVRKVVTQDPTRRI